MGVYKYFYCIKICFLKNRTCPVKKKNEASSSCEDLTINRVMAGGMQGAKNEKKFSWSLRPEMAWLLSG